MIQEQVREHSNHDCSVERKPTLLLVDESPQDLKYYTAMLRYLGYEVRSAGSYADGVAPLRREAFDLVIVDQGSRDFEGRSLLRRAVEIDRQIPVLVLSRILDAECCLDALDLGAKEYIQKPLTRSGVQDLVEEYLKSDWKFTAISGQGREIKPRSHTRMSR